MIKVNISQLSLLMQGVVVCAPHCGRFCGWPATCRLGGRSDFLYMFERRAATPQSREVTHATERCGDQSIIVGVCDQRKALFYRIDNYIGICLESLDLTRKLFLRCQWMYDVS